MGEDRLAAATLQAVRAALLEDDASADVTTLSIIDPEERGRAVLVAREACVVAGTAAFATVFHEMGDVQVRCLYQDGDRVSAGAILAELTGSLRALLAGERVALNLMQRLCGVATTTRAYVDAGAGVAIRDTRKTTPGLRALEKAAVVAGGGTNHRFSLADQILIKDNHIVAAGGIAAAIQKARASDAEAWIEIECDTLEQVEEAAALGVQEILLDNMETDEMRIAVERIAGRCRTEASGGITLERVPAIAATGVDAISVGALTHSARAVDLALEVTVGGD